MRWNPSGESRDLEDHRDEGGGGFRLGGGHIGLGGALILLVLSFIFRTNLFTLLGAGSGDPRFNAGLIGDTVTSCNTFNQPE
jgi:predicted metalloprotease